MRLRLTWIAALALSLLLLVGCGGGTDDDSSGSTAASASSESLSKDELIEKANVLCSTYNSQIDRGWGSTLPDKRADEAASYYVGMTLLLERLVKTAEDKGYSELIAAMEKLNWLESKVRFAYNSGKKVVPSSVLTKAAAALASFQETAQEYGFDECGEGLSTPAFTEASETG